jgi:hypothetical protein
MSEIIDPDPYTVLLMLTLVGTANDPKSPGRTAFALVPHNANAASRIIVLAIFKCLPPIKVTYD